MRLLTPSQTVGPFFAILVPQRGRVRLRADGTAGAPIRVEGAVRDGSGVAVPDALIEIWQADAGGRCHHPEDPRRDGCDQSFTGFGRVHTDPAGRFGIETVKPGRVPGPGRLQAPHLLVGLFARGLLARLVTRIYFDDEPSNAGDPILDRVPADRRPTLVAARLRDGAYRFDIALQGPDETVFFDV